MAADNAVSGTWNASLFAFCFARAAARSWNDCFRRWAAGYRFQQPKMGFDFCRVNGGGISGCGFDRNYGCFFVGALLAIGSMLALRQAGARAVGYAAFGWSYLVFSEATHPDASTMTYYVFGALWGVTSARLVGIEALMAPKGPDLELPPFAVRCAIVIGFLASLVLAMFLPIERTYWVPFVYLSVLIANGTNGLSMSLSRMIGVVLGVTGVLLLSWLEPPRWFEFGLATVGFVLAMRIILAFPILSRACMTAAIVLMLISVEPDVASSRLLAEVVSVLVLMLLAGSVSFFASKEEAPGDRT